MIDEREFVVEGEGDEIHDIHEIRVYEYGTGSVSDHQGRRYHDEPIDEPRDDIVVETPEDKRHGRNRKSS